jgi:hypothetical protein
MFAKGSRYRDLPVSAPIDGAGERLTGTNLRFIPLVSGQFLHTVRQRDRLDLLGFKYYGDSTRWWQICDANPQVPFPLDLLDRTPVVEELFTLVNPDSEARFQNLVAAVAAIATVQSFARSLVDAEIVATFATVAARQGILTAIAAHSLQFLKSFSWTAAAGIAEAFTLEDRVAKTAWRALLTALEVTPGVVNLQPNLSESSIRIVYIGAMVERGSLLAKIALFKFLIVPLGSEKVEQAGTKIVIPPNGAS